VATCGQKKRHQHPPAMAPTSGDEEVTVVGVPVEDAQRIEREALIKLGLPPEKQAHVVPTMHLCMKDDFRPPSHHGFLSLSNVDHVIMSLDGESCCWWNPFKKQDRTIWVHAVRGRVPQADVLVSYIQTKGGALLCRKLGEEVIGTLDKQWRNMVDDKGNVFVVVKDGDEGLLPSPKQPGVRSFTVLDENNQPHWIMSGPGGRVPFRIHHVTLPSVPVGMMRNLEVRGGWMQTDNA